MATTTTIGQAVPRGVVDTAHETVSSVNQELEAEVKSLRSQIESLRQSLVDAGHETADMVTAKAKQAGAKATSTVQHYPVTAVLAAAALGAVVVLASRMSWTGHSHSPSSRYIDRAEGMLSELRDALLSLKGRVL
ncbi:hypothetical protein LJR030_005222 [Rhizobium sp. LjRoot30]|uniref:hypothetical protein n=1 Tax=Rhizobium sp. LjRoot30 TaxID=3342320 RepID=UPI003ED0EBB1